MNKWMIIRVKVWEKEGPGAHGYKNIDFNQFSMEFYKFFYTEHCKHTNKAIYECPVIDM
jgi:hypothetical protein